MVNLMARCVAVVAGGSITLSALAQPTPTLEQTIPNPNPQAQSEFGRYLDYDSDELAVGAHSQDYDGVTAAGAVYLYEKGSSGSWTLEATIWPPHPQTASQFGRAVSIDADTIVVGAMQQDITIGSQTYTNAGAAYMFERDQGGSNAWGLVKTFEAVMPEENDGFGWRVLLRGDWLFVSVRNATGTCNDGTVDFPTGVVNVYSRNEGGTDNWGLLQVLDPCQSEFTPLSNQCTGSVVPEFCTRLYGSGLALEGDSLFVGMDDDTVQVVHQWVYEATDWVPTFEIGTSDISPLPSGHSLIGSEFAQHLYVSAGRLLVSAKKVTRDGVTQAGSGYLFEVDPAGDIAPAYLKEVDAPVPGEGHRVSNGVVMSRDIVALHSNAEANNSEGTGQALVYYRHAGGANNWGLIANIGDDLRSGSTHGGLAIFEDKLVFSVQTSVTGGFDGELLVYDLHLDDCPADVNKDGNEDSADASLFTELYNTEDPTADFNEDGSVDFFDWLAFQSDLSSGC